MSDLIERLRAVAALAPNSFGGSSVVTPSALLTEAADLIARLSADKASMPVGYTSELSLKTLSEGKGGLLVAAPSTNFPIALYASPPADELREVKIAAMSVELEKAGGFDVVRALVWATRLYDAALQNTSSTS